MSVTFGIEMGEITGFRLGCSCESNRGPVFGTYADASAYYEAAGRMTDEMLVGCEWVAKYGKGDGWCDADLPSIRALQADPGPEVNVSNANAAHLLELLGFGEGEDDGLFGMAPSEPCGSMSGSEFLGRVLAAQVLSVGDAGLPAVTEGNMVDCGRPEGYADGRLAQLHEIATWAAAHGRSVVWG